MVVHETPKKKDPQRMRKREEKFYVFVAQVDEKLSHY